MSYAGAEPAELMPDRIRRIAAAVPDLVIAAGFLITWIHPAWLGERSVESMSMTMMLEFLAIHSAGFLLFILGDGSFWKSQVPRGFALGLVYTVFIGAISMAKGTWWPLAGFWVLMANRLWTLRSGAGGAGAASYTSRWFSSCLLYFALILPTAVIPLPSLGLQPGMGAGESPGVKASGVWVDEPQSLACFGLLYFSILAWMEYRGSHESLHHGR